MTSCTSLDILDHLLQMCHKFGISAPLPAIADKLKSVGSITPNNLAKALELAQKLLQGDNDDFKDVANHLIPRIFTLIKYSLTSQEAIISFVLENKSRKKQVMELVKSLGDKSFSMFGRWSRTQWNAVMDNEEEFLDEIFECTSNTFTLNNCVFTFVLNVDKVEGNGGVAVRLVDPSNLQKVKELEKDIRIDLKLYFVNGNRKVGSRIYIPSSDPCRGVYFSAKSCFSPLASRHMFFPRFRDNLQTYLICFSYNWNPFQHILG